MTRKFGQTWWGQQWLSALQGIDLGNRLPRGQRYARNGSVTALDIKARGVRASVQGTRLAPYRVAISLKVFNTSQSAVILRLVQKNPALLARLLNRELPADILPILARENISLFPGSWQDMHATCTCPDWAVPCKHIAAAIYLLANEVDKNPFTLFSLHGLDLVEELAQQTGLQVAALGSPPHAASGWLQKRIVKPSAETALPLFDLSSVPSLQDRLFAILPAAPLFQDKDFHQQMAAMYQRMASHARRLEDSVEPQWQAAEQLETLTAVVDETGILLQLNSDAELAIVLDLPGLMRALLSLPASLETRLSSHLVVWARCCQLALRLALRSAFIPAVFTHRTGTTHIEWRPATLDSEVATLVTSLGLSCPADLVQLATSSGDLLHTTGRGQIDAALNLFLSVIAGEALATAPAALRRDPMHRLFFGSEPQTFDTFETSEHPMLIQHWLSRFSLGERDHQIGLVVNANKQDPRRLEIAIELNSGGEVKTLAGLLTPGEMNSKHLPLLADLAVLAEYLPQLEALYGESPRTSLDMNLAEFTGVFTRVLPAIRLLGIQVRLPTSLQRLAYPRLNLALASSASSGGDYLSLDSLLHFEWQVALGDTRVSVSDFNSLLADAQGLVHVHGLYVMLDDQHLKSLLKRLARLPASLSRIELLKAGLGGEIQGASVDLDDNAKALFEQLFKRAPAPLPRGLRASLRPYQRRGFEWLVQNAALGFGSLLADDMGLGKTLQVIALLQHQHECGHLSDGRVLLITPTSLLTNWQRELQRFAPDLVTHIYHGGKRSLPDQTHQLVLTSYGLARTDQAILGKLKWRTVVIDEAQNIKNPGAEQTRAIKSYHADVRIAISGTPVENRLSDYWSVFDFANRGYLATHRKFTEEFANPIERNRDQHALRRFHDITAPFILRRLKSDSAVISDLPEKIEGNHYCRLSPAQAALYRITVNEQLEDVSASDQGLERHGQVLKLLTALKQICNSPAQYLQQPPALPADSGKLEALLEIMQEADAAGEKTLVFTQYTRMGELLVQAVRQQLGLAVPFLHGGLSRGKRDKLVGSFQSDRRVRAMVLSLKAGGTGLNLTAASQVIHYDLWWNPAVEAQATDRAYRIGQGKRVQVHRLITANTLEEKIDQMMQDKKELAELTVGSGEKWITRLSNRELRQLVALGGS